MKDPTSRICIVGLGPRGLSVLERLAANARAAVPRHPVVVHVVDPREPRAEAVRVCRSMFGLGHGGVGWWRCGYVAVGFRGCGSRRRRGRRF
jgi:hypothetical protein